MRKLGSKLMFSALCAGAFVGCGGDDKKVADVPANVDFSKDYTPKVDVGPIRPGDMKKAMSGKDAPKSSGAPGMPGMPGMPGAPGGAPK